MLEQEGEKEVWRLSKSYVSIKYKWQSLNVGGAHDHISESVFRSSLYEQIYRNGNHSRSRWHRPIIGEKLLKDLINLGICMVHYGVEAPDPNALGFKTPKRHQKAQKEYHKTGQHQSPERLQIHKQTPSPIYTSIPSFSFLSLSLPCFFTLLPMTKEHN